MKFSSSAFGNGERIPEKYTCVGEGISPPLEWSNLPASTESLALSMVDPDAPGGDFVHWLVYNIKPEQGRIAQGDIPTGVELESDGGSKGYYPPCPPATTESGDVGHGPPSGEHRYVFKLYALGKEIEDVNKENFFDKVKQAKIDEEEIVGLFSK